ncbi:hypothetical protein [Pseudonocardia sp.]|uniref:hypothetical protein n=1 Tax=Pseudonocardia sp. TaxID=60912 RepID=UPI003D126515
MTPGADSTAALQLAAENPGFVGAVEASGSEDRADRPDDRADRGDDVRRVPSVVPVGARWGRDGGGEDDERRDRADRDDRDGRDDRGRWDRDERRDSDDLDALRRGEDRATEARKRTDEERSRADAERKAREAAEKAAEKAKAEAARNGGNCAGLKTGGLGAVKPHVREAGGELGCRFGKPVMLGVAGRGGPSDHPGGLAIDFMVNRATGDQLAECALANMKALGVKYVIWRQRINHGSGWKAMEDRGGVTANHFDHVHVSFNRSAGGGGLTGC